MKTQQEIEAALAKARKDLAEVVERDRKLAGDFDDEIASCESEIELLEWVLS